MSELGEREHDWDEVVSAADPAECDPVKTTDPLYILYTSGTAGRPASDVGWQVGHPYTVYGSLTQILGQFLIERGLGNHIGQIPQRLRFAGSSWVDLMRQSVYKTAY
jgi:acyl-coenzyme A synthetase/AMP-(fatty) acid ligase